MIAEKSLLNEIPKAFKNDLNSQSEKHFDSTDEKNQEIQRELKRRLGISV